MDQWSNDAAVKDAQAMLKAEECAAVKNAQTLPLKEECALSMEQSLNCAAMKNAQSNSNRRNIR